MFEKLLANLPYNPDLSKQVAFYARRMRHEETIRRTAMVFILLAFVVQFFAFISPPQSTTAYSSSDMINGGISSKADAVSACRQNVKNYQDVLWNFGVTCADIAQSHVTSVRSTDFDNRLYSLSWLPYGQTNPRSGKPTDETPYNLTKVSETIYARRLRSADTIPSSAYKVLQGTAANGKTFYIMFDCGNLMFVGVPQIVRHCPYNDSLLASSSQCVEPCPISGLHNLPKSSAKCVAPCPYNKNVPSNSTACFKPCTYNPSVPAGSVRCYPPCPYNAGVSKTSSACKPCSNALSSENAVACIVQTKAAANLTQNLGNADGTTAQPNDVITYTLSADNRGKATVKAYVMQESLSDVLDYADVVDLDNGTLSDSTGIISWKPADIAAGTRLTHKITVRVKSSLPTNTPPAGDPGHFDRIMTNVYGTTVNINLQPDDTAPAASASESLPNTGPGSGLMLAFGIVVVAGYFFARARLLVNESVIVLQETKSGRL